ncbi:sensor histidine kinase [Arthrobacter sulfonylureivorans]|uniref:histidine kinase n=1 Tax=Arthrobacter sulfonylureivorans TaxID=2486855 RepID=A0ABY3W4W8_9MICC|nr:histidine kinase [Arthrobacter sulfonylureivorans]UNK45282.1 histidine kinase [Arthrobacter sulfonylureivorans]
MMIGALLAVPYIVVFIWATQLAAVSPANAVVAFAVLVLLLAVPAALSATRALERTAVGELLAVKLAEPAGPVTRQRRIRGAVWYLVHLMAGGLTLVAIAFAAPLILAAVILPLLGNADSANELAAAVVPFTDGTTAALWSLGLSTGVIIFTILTGMALPHWASLLLGPSPAEHRELEEEQARMEARRNELARELHDSVGHALTVTTLQATAAEALLGRDPDGAARAMRAVADTGRSALAELDRVIGILRAPGAQVENPAGLRQLPGYLDHMEDQGLHVEREFETQMLEEVPAAASAPAFKILQEGLTNTLKYASPREPVLHIHPIGRYLQIRLVNPIAESSDAAAPRPSGRGIAGMQERARLAGGSTRSQLAGGRWILSVDIPLQERAR